MLFSHFRQIAACEKSRTRRSGVSRLQRYAFLPLGKEREMKGKRNMNPTTVLELVNVFFAGMLAGIEFVIHYGLRAPAEVLDEQSQIQLRQALVLRLRVLVPAFFIPTAVSGIAVTVLDGGAPGFWLRCAGVLAALIWILIRVIGTVPINSATLTWQPSAPPKNWKALVNHAERFHIVGVWAVVLAFALFLTAVALKLAAH
jgi:hypothetical protein